jgi:Peptidase family M28
MVPDPLLVWMCLMKERKFIYLILVLFLTLNCSKKQKLKKDNVKKINLASLTKIKTNLKYISSKEFNGRLGFTKYSLKTAMFIAEKFKKLGLTPFNKKLSLGTPGKNSIAKSKPEDYFQTFKRWGKEDQNIVGYIKGCTEKIILIGAHYDHLGVKKDKIYYGADDNGTGTVVLIEVARILAGKKFGKSIYFVAFGAEELGLIGSRKFVKNMPFPKKNLDLMINMDMLGRGFMELTMGDKSKNHLGFVVNKIPDNRLDLVENKMKIYNLVPKGFSESIMKSFNVGFGYDSMPFNRIGISTLFFTTGLHKDYHQPTDSFEKIDLNKLKNIANYLVDLIYSIGELNSDSCKVITGR